MSFPRKQRNVGTKGTSFGGWLFNAHYILSPPIQWVHSWGYSIATLVHIDVSGGFSELGYITLRPGSLGYVRLREVRSG